MRNNLILAISGNDIFSGGGLHADLATYTVNQLHGFVAVTCLTAMTEQGFEVIPVDSTVFLSSFILSRMCLSQPSN